MLLQKYRGQADGSHQDAGSDAHQPVLFQRFALHDGDVRADGVVHVNAGEHVGGCIRPVQGGHRRCKYIFVRIQGRAEIRTVVEEGTDNQADGHAGE